MIEATVAQVLAGEARWHVAHEDAFWFAPQLPENSLDGIVTDPPSGIGFMGRKWDSARGGRDHWIAWLAVIADRALRALKPGAHGLVWSLPRTSHWTAMALENAGFEIRDSVQHIFGSGMPKSYNVDAALRALDSGGSARPEDIRREAMGADYAPSGRARANYDHGGGSVMNGRASQPSALGTALKPAHETWLLVRKPLEGSIAQNVRKWGTGALNIAGARVAHAGAADLAAHRAQVAAIKDRGGSLDNSWKNSSDLSGANDVTDDGRFPANLVLSHADGCQRVGTRSVKSNPTWDTPNRETESTFTGSAVSQVRHGDGDTEEVPVWECAVGCPVLELDRQSGVRRNGGRNDPECEKSMGPAYGVFSKNASNHAVAGEAGSASRFFPQFQRSELDELAPFIYAAKPARAERDRGLENFRLRDLKNPGGETERGVRNPHPTGKSIELLRYFLRLAIPRGGVVGDFFTGSGSTGVAAVIEGLRFIGCEREDTEEEPFVSIARARLAHACGYEFVPRESLRTGKPPRQQSLFGAVE
jgi:hypothetical protein